MNYSYDSAGNVTEVSAQHGYTFPGTRPWLFASANQTLSSRTAGAHMSYTYDARNRLWKVFSNPGKTVVRATYTYDVAGNLSAVAYGNSVISSYFYNARNQLRYLKAANGATVYASFDYDDYDTGDGVTFPAERKLAKSGLRRGLAEFTKYSTTEYRRLLAYDYDNLNRLRAERIRSTTGTSWPSWAPAAVPTTPAPGDVLYDFTVGYDLTGFDKAGNRRSRKSSGVNLLVSSGSTLLQEQASMAYDPNDRLNYLALPASYDRNGNALYQSGYVSQVTPSAVVPGASTPDQYDLDNRLVQRSDGSTTVSIVYDGDGNRVKKVFDAPSTENDLTVFYLVDDRNQTGYAQVLEEQPSAGASPTVRYIYGLDLILQDRSNTIRYYGYDGQGTVRYLTSTTPSVSARYAYDAFGILLAKSGTTINNYLYTGEQWDPDLGMYYLRARYYHPDLGRFWTMDSFEGDNEDPPSLHKYLYAADNPVNLTDPTGWASLGDVMVTMRTIASMTANIAIRATPLLNRVTVVLYEVATGETVLIGGGAIGGYAALSRVEGGIGSWTRALTDLKGIRFGPYGYLRSLIRGSIDQAGHLNQVGAYKAINKKVMACVDLSGNALSRGTEHNQFHLVLEKFWAQYREGGAKFRQAVSNKEYLEALREALGGVKDSVTGLRRFTQKQCARGLRGEGATGLWLPRRPRWTATSCAGVDEYQMKPSTRSKLEKILTYPFFQSVGKPLPDDVKPIENWCSAMKEATSSKWESCRLQARNALDEIINYRARDATDKLEQCRYWERLQEWDRIGQEIGAVIDPFIGSMLPKTCIPAQFVEKMKSKLSWDLWLVCLEEEYKDLVQPPFYLRFLDPWYASGHFPCGWDGMKFPECWPEKDLPYLNADRISELWDAVVRKGRPMVF